MDNLYTISSNKVSATISTKAAEVHIFKSNNDDYNFAWSGDTKYWRGRNPILFPQVSSTENKTVLVNGVSYPMGNHGFARDSVFKVEEVKEDEITLSLSENEETLKQYPFKFKLKVNYKIINQKLLITYNIKNNSEINMPFGFGLHPAFVCPENYDNTFIDFEQEEDNTGKKLIISKELFEKHPTYTIYNPKSTYTILNTNNKQLKVGIEGFKILAFWSSGPFVCIEPWMNETESDPNIEMAKRKGILELKPKESFNISYYWEIV